MSTETPKSLFVWCTSVSRTTSASAKVRQTRQLESNTKLLVVRWYSSHSIANHFAFQPFQLAALGFLRPQLICMRNWPLCHIQFGGARLIYEIALLLIDFQRDQVREHVMTLGISRPGPFSNLELCAHKLPAYLNVGFIKRRLEFDRWSIALVLTNCRGCTVPDAIKQSQSHRRQFKIVKFRSF